jgi:hypothetical protein
MELMGDSTVAMSQKYAHPSPEFSGMAAWVAYHHDVPEDLAK